MKKFLLKRGLLLIFLSLLLILNVFAQETPTPASTPPASPNPQTPSEDASAQPSQIDLARSEDWLLNTSLTTTPSVFDQSLALLALAGKTSRSTELGALAERLLEAKDQTDNCWPQGQCTTKDTALALLALEKTGNSNLDASKTWLRTALKSGLRTSGEWRIQIETQNDGTCTLSWGENKKKDFQIIPC